MKNKQQNQSAGSVRKALRSNKFKRGGLSTLMCVVFIAIVIVLNLVVSTLSQRFPSMNIDLTAQKINTLSDQALEIAKGIEEETRIYLIGSEDAYRKDQISSQVKYSQVANLADRLKEANGKIKTQYIDPDKNPQFISQYASESLTTGKVLVETDKRYRVLTTNDFFGQDQQTYEIYSKVDSALAAALEAVNLDKVPVVAVVTGHGELLGSDMRSSFDGLLERENFDVQEIELLTGEIPEEAQVVLITAPSTDYTDGEIEKLRTFLASDGPLSDRTVMVTCDYAQGELPKLAEFLEEWGVKAEQGLVAETDSSQVLMDATSIFASSAEEVLEDNAYRVLVSPRTTPLSMVFSANDEIGVQKLWVSSDSAYVFTDDMKEGDTPKTGEQLLATLSSKIVQDGNDIYSKNVVMFGSTQMFVSSYLSNTFSNRQYLMDLFHYVTATDDSSVTTVLTEEVTTTAVDITASAATLNMLGLGVFTVGIPLALLIAGIVVFLKRRHL